MNKEFLFKLLDSFGPSGFEEQTLSVFCKEMEEKQKFFVEKNVYNSCIAMLPVLSRKKVLIVGHIDEIGFMLKAITKSGYLKVKAIGGVCNSNLF
jgi:endoglucanase